MKFSQKILRIGNFEKLSFFELAIFKFSFSKKQKICFIPIRISHKLCVRMDGTHYDSLQPKMSAGIINEQGRNHKKFLAATSAMVGRICPPWLR
jgi:hypothetical protein